MRQYQFSLGADMVQVIANALNEVPYKYAAPVIAEMQKQLTEQSQQSVADEGNDDDQK